MKKRLTIVVTVMICCSVAALQQGSAAETCMSREGTIIGTEGNDTLRGTSKADVIIGLGGDDTIEGRGDDDTICGGPGNDLISGNAGGDFMFGNEDNDILRGGADPDWLTPGAGDDEVAGGPEVFEVGPRDQVMYDDSPNPVTVNLPEGTATGHGRDSLSEIEEIIGSNHDDVLIGTAESNSVYGGEGDDRLETRGGRDSASGGNGSDVVHSGGGDDRLFGDREKPFGADEYVGGPGQDDLELMLTGVDLVVDLAAGTARGQGEDSVDGIENVTGGRGNDRLLGDDGPNRLSGQNGADYLNGRGGNDVAHGGFKSDRCLNFEKTFGCEDNGP